MRKLTPYLAVLVVALAFWPVTFALLATLAAAVFALSCLVVPVLLIAGVLTLLSK